MGTGFSKRKKQAKLFQQQFSALQDQIRGIQVSGSAGNKLVEVFMNSEHELLSVHIDPECVDKEDIEGLEMLVKAAVNDATNNLKQKTSEGIPSGLPGLKDLGL